MNEELPRASSLMGFMVAISVLTTGEPAPP